jgi:hypothetical protein
MLVTGSLASIGCPYLFSSSLSLALFIALPDLFQTPAKGRRRNATQPTFTVKGAMKVNQQITDRRPRICRLPKLPLKVGRSTLGKMDKMGHLIPSLENSG